MLMYRTSFNRIDPLEVVRVTDKQVVRPAKNGYKETRENKNSDWRNWHDSWEAAHTFLIERAAREVVAARIQLERAEGVLEQIKGMKPTHE